MVLEVGTGTGSLTAMMAEQAASVVTVEIDAHLFELASEQLIDLPNVTMLKLDALRNKNNFDDRVMDAVGEQLAAAPGRRLKLVANLPYNIATPLLSNLLLSQARAPFDDGHDPKGAGRANHRVAIDQRLQRTQRLDSKPVHGRDCPPDAAFGLLAGAESYFRHLRIVVDPERRAQIADLQFFHQITKALISSIAASFSARTSWPQ